MIESRGGQRWMRGPKISSNLLVSGVVFHQRNPEPQRNAINGRQCCLFGHNLIQTSPSLGLRLTERSVLDIFNAAVSLLVEPRLLSLPIITPCQSAKARRCLLLDGLLNNVAEQRSYSAINCAAASTPTCGSGLFDEEERIPCHSVNPALILRLYCCFHHVSASAFWLEARRRTGVSWCLPNRLRLCVSGGKGGETEQRRQRQAEVVGSWTRRSNGSTGTPLSGLLSDKRSLRGVSGQVRSGPGPELHFSANVTDHYVMFKEVIYTWLST